MHLQDIYTSIQGELPNLGRPCTIIRLAGCNLTCSYCDTPEKPTYDLTIKDIVDQVQANNLNEVLITGGEPLLQLPELVELIEQLAGQDYNCVVETNGTISIRDLPDHLTIVMDVKLFDGGCTDETISNLSYLHHNDAIKFVYQNEQELDKAILFTRALILPDTTYLVIFSPIDKTKVYHEKISQLAKDFPGLDIRLQTQIHKILSLG